MLSEIDIKRIAEIAKRELGDQATSEMLKQIVREVVRSLNSEDGFDSTNLSINKQICIVMVGRKMERAKDTLVSTITKTGCKVMELKVDGLGEFTSLFLLVDILSCSVDFSKLETQLVHLANEFGGKLIIQN